jgi:ribulose-phosphate 3-epimerase
MRNSRRANFRIEIDGGVSLETVGEIARAGAEILVAGNAVFASGDPSKNVAQLLRAANEAMLQKV